MVLKNRSNEIRSNEIGIRRELPVDILSMQFVGFYIYIYWNE